MEYCAPRERNLFLALGYKLNHLFLRNNLGGSPWESLAINTGIFNVNLLPYSLDPRIKAHILLFAVCGF